MVQASVLVPSIFIEHDPQMPSRQERRKVSVGSMAFLIQISASSTIGPQLSQKIGVHAGGLSIVGIPAIDAVLAHVRCARGALPDLALGDLRVLRKCELDHAQYTPAKCSSALG